MTLDPARIRRIVVFMLLACAWSWPVFWMRDMRPDLWHALPLPPPLRNTLLMWGPGIAALICFRLFRGAHQPTIGFHGGQPLRALAFYGLPMLALGLVGITSPEFGPQPVHLMVAAIAVLGFINVLGEETGWRRFLQDELRVLGKPARYALIGVLWTAWHFTNVFAHRSGAETLQYLAWYLPLTIALSAVIGEATDRARAVVVAVTLHAWMDIAFEFPGTGTWAVLAGSLVFWALMLRAWPQREAGAASG